MQQNCPQPLAPLVPTSQVLGSQVCTAHRLMGPHVLNPELWAQ